LNENIDIKTLLDMAGINFSTLASRYEEIKKCLEKEKGINL